MADNSNADLPQWCLLFDDSLQKRQKLFELLTYLWPNSTYCGQLNDFSLIIWETDVVYGP